jgi:hypothetical protein
MTDTEPWLVLAVVEEPFPFAVVDGFWDRDLLLGVREEVEQVDLAQCRRYLNERENKYDAGAHLFPPGTRTHELFNAMRDLAEPLSQAFGIEGLAMEEMSGCHLIPPGGFLAVHTDWNRSQWSGLYRRLNLLVYLNEDWDEEGGCLHLEGVDPPTEIRIKPEFNRTVALEASDRAWHGHPLATANRWRYSAAGYFSAPEPPAGFKREHDTEWLR